MSKLKSDDKELAKLDLTEAYIDKFVDLRLAYIKVLEKHIITGDLHILEALRLFKRACMWQPAQAKQYLLNMCSETSPFKRLAGLDVDGEKVGMQ